MLEVQYQKFIVRQRNQNRTTHLAVNFPGITVVLLFLQTSNFLTRPAVSDVRITCD